MLPNTPKIPQPYEIELHLRPSSELVARFGKRIKSLGGRYSACRGYSDKRFVHIPFSAAGLALADELLLQFGHETTVVFRCSRHDHNWGDASANITVQYRKQDEPIMAVYARFMGSICLWWEMRGREKERSMGGGE